MAGRCPCPHRIQVTTHHSVYPGNSKRTQLPRETRSPRRATNSTRCPSQAASTSVNTTDKSPTRLVLLKGIPSPDSCLGLGPLGLMMTTQTMPRLPTCAVAVLTNDGQRDGFNGMVFSPSGGGQKSETKVSMGPCSLQRL